MHSSPRFHAQPFLMQGMAMYLSLSGDKSWVLANYPKLKKYLEYWKNVYAAPFGLFYWGASWMSGFDNDISSTIMLPQTVITPDLCSWIYMEYLAAAQIAKTMNWSEDAEKYCLLAAELKKQINAILWNEKDQSYCAYNVRLGKHLFSYGDLTGEHFIGKYAFQSCSNLIPLYARIASPEQARSMIEKYVIAPEHFWSEFGVRSLSRSSEYYNNALWGNPGRYSEQPVPHVAAVAVERHGQATEEVRDEQRHDLLGELERPVLVGRAGHDDRHVVRRDVRQRQQVRGRLGRRVRRGRP